jgi:hypothetical protein
MTQTIGNYILKNCCSDHILHISRLEVETGRKNGERYEIPVFFICFDHNLAKTHSNGALYGSVEWP